MLSYRGEGGYFAVIWGGGGGGGGGREAVIWGEGGEGGFFAVVWGGGGGGKHSQACNLDLLTRDLDRMLVCAFTFC